MIFLSFLSKIFLTITKYPLRDILYGCMYFVCIGNIFM